MRQLGTRYLMNRSSLFFVLSFVVTTAAAQMDCAALVKVTLPNATVVSAEVMPAAAGSAPSIPGLAARPATAPYCKVKGVAAPATDSTIGFEVWMPIAD